MAVLTSPHARGIVSFVTSTGPLYRVANETNRKLEIHSRDHRLLVLAPFEIRTDVSAEDVERFDLRGWGDEVRVDDQPVAPPVVPKVLVALPVVLGRKS
jgi:hypothetical protein